MIKVKKVTLKRFKSIEDLEVDLDGKSVFLTGENGRGKSSFMQAIKIALGSSDDVPPNMTGNGVVEVTKDGQPYTFAFKTGKSGKPELSVTLPDGTRESKKGIIGGLVGPISFDINHFVSLSDSTSGRKEQVEQFKRLLPAEFINGLEVFEKKVKTLYDDRTELGRKITTLEGFVKESKLFGDDLKRKPVDVTALNADLERANAHNNKVKEVQSRYEDRAKNISAKESEIEELEKKIAALKESLKEDNEKQNGAKDWLSKNKEVETSSLIEAINNASTNNVIAAQAEEHNKKLKQLKEFREEYEDYTVQIETNKQAIADAIRDFDSPVEGLTFDDEKLIYNGIPVNKNSLSESEIMELGMKMAFASNPECGLIFMEKANEIGKKRLEYIMEFAKKYDLQLFFEEVRRGQDELLVEFVPE